MLELKRSISFRKEDFDSDENIKASSLMYSFQEIAAEHADKLGFGFDDMIKNNRIWVLNKLKFRIYGRLKKDVEYELSTYPRPKKGVSWFRDYYLRDEHGALMTAGASQWCIINFDTRRIERTGLDFDGEYIDHPAFEEGIEKIRIPELTMAGKHTVTETDLDENRHTNNCRYADMISDVLGRSDHESFTINFTRETRLGDEIMLYTGVGETEESKVVVGKSADGSQVFHAGIKFGVGKMT